MPLSAPGCREATAELVDLMPELLRVSRALTRDAAKAEDLAQETLLRVWAQIAAGARIANLRFYLLASARNLARRPPPPLRELTEREEPSVPPEAPGRLALGEVLRALSRQPRSEVKLMLRQAAGGESYAAIAEAEGLPLGTVMSRLSRLRSRLREECGLPSHGPVAALLVGEDAA